MHCAGSHEEDNPAEAPPSAANGRAKTGTHAKAGSAPGGPDAKPGSAPGVRGDSKLRRGAVGFEWKDVMLTPPTSVTARDAVYELGQRAQRGGAVEDGARSAALRRLASGRSRGGRLPGETCTHVAHHKHAWAWMRASVMC